MYEILINNTFDNMKVYIRESRDLMHFKKDQMMQNFKVELDSFPDSYELTTRVYSEYYENYDRRFVGILMNSTFTSAYTLFEVIFDKICEFAEKRYRLKLSAADLSGNEIIGKSKKYIERVAGVDLSSIDKYWIELTTYRKVRNCITHSMGVIKSSDTFLTDYVRNHSSIGLFNPLEKRTTTFYIKDTAYIIDFCSLAHDYLTYVLQELVKLPLPKNQNPK
jgi:hypothetical protein